MQKILFKVEEDYKDTDLIDLKIEGYSMIKVTYHCNLLSEAGLIDRYDPGYSDDGLDSFYVGSLTWEGHNFLDGIMSDTTWHKIKHIIRKKSLPLTVEIITTVAAKLSSAALS